VTKEERHQTLEYKLKQKERRSQQTPEQKAKQAARRKKEKYKTRNKARRQTLKYKIKRENWRNQHPGARSEEKKIYYIENKEDIMRCRNNYYEDLRQKVFSHYGWQCACCSEAEPDALTIDHIAGNGNRHRNPKGVKYRGIELYRWLIKNNYPKDFQTLCWNCNCMKGKPHNHNQCPHKKTDYMDRVGW
jgi:ribosome-binding ATPase YchF (GTP1/OBG family)